MQRVKLILLLLGVIAGFGLLVESRAAREITSSMFDAVVVDLKNQDLGFYWKGESGEIFGNFGSLEEWGKKNGKELRFATNGGIFEKGQIPLGLYIENGEKIVDINKNDGDGNFYLKPNGIFFIEEKVGKVVKSEDFLEKPGIQYALQSGPMLLIDGKIHPEFSWKSQNRYNRSGVGELEDGQIVFAISKEPVSFYELAEYFQTFWKCKNALYLDGAISKMYAPGLNRKERFGRFAGMIGVFEDTKKVETTFQVGELPVRIGIEGKHPRILKRVDPKYPEGIDGTGLSGLVIMEAVIEKSGKAGRVEVLRSSGNGKIDKAIMDAIEKWEFEAGEVDGRAVDSLMTFTVNIHLRR